jgi:DNA-binding transcriptional MerR regulator/methylmalonyl-CoA mutase cobalamin-binding subunit
MADDPQYPIGAVAQRTGLSTHVLRAWERRYGLVEPGRSESGVRLYSNEDIVRLRLLRRVTESGHPIGRVAELSTEQLLALVREDEQTAERAGTTRITAAADQAVARCLAAVEAMDGGAIHGVLTRSVTALSLMEFVEGVVSPLLRRVGELWHGGALCPAHEHLLSVCVQRVLAWLMHSLGGSPDAPLLLATTPRGQRHELGAMLAAVVAADVGWRTVYFGPNLPVDDIARAAASTGADAVALSAVYLGEGTPLLHDLCELRSRLSGDVFLFTGGAAVERERAALTDAGVICLADLGALRIALQATGRASEVN